MAADPEELCFKGQHLAMSLLMGLPQLLIYVVGMPFLALLVLYRNRAHLQNARTKYRWGILYVGLREERYFWDVGVVALRKAAIFAISVIGISGDVIAWQTHYTMLVLILSLLAHLAWRPYKAEWYLLDVFEVGGLVICWVLMWSGIWFYLDDVSTDNQELVTICLVILNVAFALYFCVIFINQKVREQASWVPFVRRTLCGCVSDSTLQLLGSWLPGIDPASQYLVSTQLLQRAYAESRALVHGPSSEGSGVEMENCVENPYVGCEDEESKPIREGWYESVDPGTGKKFYFSLRGETQWEVPWVASKHQQPNAGTNKEAKHDAGGIRAGPGNKGRDNTGTRYSI